MKSSVVPLQGMIMPSLADATDSSTLTEVVPTATTLRFSSKALDMVSAAAGLIVAIPALRLSGLYLAIATMGFGFIIEQLVVQWKSVTGGANGMMVDRPSIFGQSLNSDQSYYYLVIIMLAVFALNMVSTPTHLDNIPIWSLL